MHPSSLARVISKGGCSSGLASAKKRLNNGPEYSTILPKAPFVPISIEISDEDKVLVRTTLDPLRVGNQDSDVVIVKEECHVLDFEEREALLGNNEPRDDGIASGQIAENIFKYNERHEENSVELKGLSTSSNNKSPLADNNKKRKEPSDSPPTNIEHENNVTDSCEAPPSECDEDEVLKIFNPQPPMQSAAPKRNRKPTQKTAEYLCRLCGQHSYKLVKIFGTQGKQMLVADKINLHLPIMVNEKDLLPLGICLVCLTALKTSDDLYNNSLSTDNRLRQIFLKDNSTSKLSGASQAKKKVEVQLPLDEDPNDASNEMGDFIIKISENGQQSSSTIAEDIHESGTKITPNISAVAKNNGALKNDAEKSDESKAESSGEGGSDCVDSNAEESSSEEDEEQEGEEEEEEEEENEKEDNEDGASDNAQQVKKQTLTKTEKICDLCEKACLGVFELAKHRRTHSPEERLTCKDCGKRMPNDGSFYNHRKTHIINLHPCELCGKVLSNKSSLKNHVMLHSDPKFCCDICGKSTYTRAKLRIHMVVHTDERPFCCSTCGQRFKTKHVHDQHVITHNEKRMFICEICGHGVHRPGHLAIHMQIHHKRQNGIPASRSNEKCLKRWQCKLCFVQCSSHKILLEHYESDHPEMISKEEMLCPKCGKRYLDKQTLKSHKSYCGLVYSCEYCDRIFATHTGWKLHTRDHTGERPYKCKFCAKSFKSALLFKYHERLHTGERPYKCPVCNKGFRSQTNLYQHSFVHGAGKKHKCELCDYETPRPGAMRKHQLVHTGERPYRCDVCGKDYKYSGDLKNHVKLHSTPGGLYRQRNRKRKSSARADPVVLDSGSLTNDSNQSK